MVRLTHTGVVRVLRLAFYWMRAHAVTADECCRFRILLCGHFAFAVQDDGL